MSRIGTGSLPATHRRGYTLAELVIALPIMALLMAGLGTAIKIAQKSVPDGTSVSDAALTAARSLDLFAGEVAFANAVSTDVTAAGATRSLTFTIADRDGLNPTSETVTYSWSGVAGDPLQRTFNGTTTTVATNVQEFSLAYDKRVKSVVTTSTSTSAETLLVSNDGTTTVADSAITTTNWCGQYFVPLVGSNVTGWNVTRVDFMAMLNGTNNGQTLVEIRTAANELPTNTVLASQTLLESSLTSSYVMKTINFTGVPMQSPMSGLCLVLKLGANSPSGTAQFWAGGKVNTNYFSTVNTGSTWTAGTGNSLRLKVYGTVTTESSSTTNQYLLTNVRASLRVGNSANSRITTSIRVPNEPQVTGP